MIVHKIISSSYDSNIYLILSKSKILIDTGTGQGYYFKKLVENLKNICALRIEKIILTHCHYDHTGGACLLKELTGAEMFIHVKDANAIVTGNNISTGARMFGGSQEPLNVLKLDNGDAIDCGEINLEIIHTPGHTPGSISIYEPASKSLFSGDTVFADGATGRWDLPGGNYRELLQSVKKLSKLDIDNLYPGHGEVVEGNGKEHIKRALEFLEEFG